MRRNQTPANGHLLRSTSQPVPATLNPTNTRRAGLFNTRRNGTYRIGYTFHGDDPEAESIAPQLAAYVLGDDPGTDDTVETNYRRSVTLTPMGDAVTVYWADVGGAEESEVDSALAFVDVLAVDVHNRRIVVSEGVAADPGDGISERRLRSSCR